MNVSPVRHVALAILAAALPACGGDAKPEPFTPEPPPGQPVPVAALAIKPAKARIDAGSALPLAVVATAADGRPVAAAPDWSTDMPDVATVDESGVVRGVSPGYVRITASAGAASSYALIHIQRNGLYPDRVDITPADTLLDTCTPRMFSAATLPDVDVPRFAWRTSDTAVVRVDSTGLAHGVAPGRARITARWRPDTSRVAHRDLTVVTCGLAPVQVADVARYADTTTTDPVHRQTRTRPPTER